MNVSRQIAGLAGPTLLVLTLSEAVNHHAIANTTPAVIYLYGGIIFVAGLAILGAHNRWTFSWPVLVTILGWAFLLGGLLWMFAPAVQQDMADTLKLPIIAILFVVAIFLTVKAYVPDIDGGTRRPQRRQRQKRLRRVRSRR